MTNKYSIEVDTYLADAAAFAKPILLHWRRLVHENCPEVQEAVKWSFPHFDYKNDNFCVIAAYKTHCSFSFLKAELMSDPRLKDSKNQKAIQRFLGKVTKMDDLPPDGEFIVMLKEAMHLNEQCIKIKREKPKSDNPKILETPNYLLTALATNPGAKTIFESKSNSFRKEYIVWITDAKTDETRQKRINEALTWIAEGKSRFWQHKK